MSGQLTDGFRNLIDMDWSEMVSMEKDEGGNNFEAVITTIARACKKGNLRAIQTGLDRLDGKIATEIEVEYPKFFTIFPRAEKVADDPSIIEINPDELHGKKFDMIVTNEVVGAPADMDELSAAEEELPTGSLRASLERMLDSPKILVTQILDAADRVDNEDYTAGDPKVKSVIVAGLMKLIHDGRLNAVLEVFDQIDGKVADKYKVLGSDVYMRNYSLIAPAGAERNEDGIYMIVADDTTNAWVARLEEKNSVKRIR